MYKIPKNRQAIIRQKEILNAFSSFLQKNYLKDITVSRLCEEISIPRKAFYRYFDSINDLIDLWADNLFQEMIDNTNISYNTERDMEKLLIEFFNYWASRTETIEIIRKNQLSNHIFSRFVEKTFVNELDNIITDTNKDELRIRIQIVLPGLISILYYWSDEKYKTSPKDLAKLTYRILSKPLI